LPFLLLVTSFAQNQWVTTENTNAMDNITIRTSTLNSDSGEKAALIIRYTGSKPEVYIATADVTVKLDGYKTEERSVTPDGKTIPIGITLIKQ
jgi:hypothetical protein